MEKSESRPRMSVRTDSCRKLLKKIWLNESKDQNFVFSPFSLYVALGLLASGSDGQTLEQILEFLVCESIDRLNKVISRLIKALDEIGRSGDGGGPKLTLISGIWTNSDCTLKPSFKEIASSIYRAKARSVDFKTKAREVIEKVNKWVEKKTSKLIKDLLPDGSLNKRTRAVLANALYFKGSWEEDQFDPSQTEDSNFYLLDGSTVRVPFRTYGQEYQYVSCYKGFKVLQLPYKQAATDNQYQTRFSMYIFLPDKKNGLQELIEKVSSDPGFLDRHLPTQKVVVGAFLIPKFKISFSFEAGRVLKDLGLDLPFHKDKAELTEMLMGPSVEDGTGRLFVKEVFHKCFVEVDEEGTKAVAATIVGYSSYDDDSEDEEPRRLISFVADHPFMFIVRGNRNGVVLFMGVVHNPLLN